MGTGLVGHPRPTHHLLQALGGPALGLSASPGAAQRRGPGRWLGSRTLPATPGANLFFPRYPSWRKRSAAGSRKAHHSLPPPSRGTRRLPQQCRPAAWEAGLRLCEERPGLPAGRPGASPTPNNTPQDPLLVPSQAQQQGLGVGRGQTCTLTRPHPQFHLVINFFLTASCGVSFSGQSPMCSRLKQLLYFYLIPFRIS